ncbi:hypothetical protein VTI74DRAFT_1186 [Chaetomium olivicolor]
MVNSSRHDDNSNLTGLERRLSASIEDNVARTNEVQKSCGKTTDRVKGLEANVAAIADRLQAQYNELEQKYNDLVDRIRTNPAPPKLPQPRQTFTNQGFRSVSSSTVNSGNAFLNSRSRVPIMPGLEQLVSPFAMGHYDTVVDAGGMSVLGRVTAPDRFSHTSTLASSPVPTVEHATAGTGGTDQRNLTSQPLPSARKRQMADDATPSTKRAASVSAQPSTPRRRLSSRSRASRAKKPNKRFHYQEMFEDDE